MSKKSSLRNHQLIENVIFRAKKSESFDHFVAAKFNFLNQELSFGTVCVHLQFENCPKSRFDT